MRFNPIVIILVIYDMLMNQMMKIIIQKNFHLIQEKNLQIRLAPIKIKWIGLVYYLIIY